TEALLVVRVGASQPDALEVSARVRTAMARLASVDVVELRADEVPSFPSRLASELSARLAGLAVRYVLPVPGNAHRRLEDAVRALDAARVEPVVRRALAEYFASDEALVSARSESEPESAAGPRLDRLARRVAPLVASEGTPEAV